MLKLGESAWSPSARAIPHRSVSSEAGWHSLNSAHRTSTAFRACSASTETSQSPRRPLLKTRVARTSETGAHLTSPFTPIHISRGAARLSFTARIEGPPFHRGSSASKKDGLAAPLSQHRRDPQDDEHRDGVSPNREAVVSAVMGELKRQRRGVGSPHLAAKTKGTFYVFTIFVTARWAEHSRPRPYTVRNGACPRFLTHVLPLLGCNLLERKMWNIRSIMSMFNGHGAHISILVDIELCVLIEIPSLCHFCRSKFYMERVGVLKILDRHGLNLLSKKALCTVSPSGSITTRKNLFSISSIEAQRRIRPSFCTISFTGLFTTRSIHSSRMMHDQAADE